MNHYHFGKLGACHKPKTSAAAPSLKLMTEQAKFKLYGTWTVALST